VHADFQETDMERLFLGAVDGSLTREQAAEFDAALESDPALRARFDAYRTAVAVLRSAPREKPPEGFASLVLRRSRRRRFQLRRSDGTAYRVPAEIIISLVLAALVALLMMMTWAEPRIPDSPSPAPAGVRLK
jgi:anti-sigma factor RsiW